jgi:hypothetical protein
MATARKRSTSTASGQVRLDPGFGPARITKATRNPAGTFQEIGRTGLRHWGGFVFEEWLRELQQGRRAAEVYREMGDSDAIISGLLYAIDILCRRVSWWCEPGGDTRADEEAKDFAEQCLFEDMQYSWSETLSEILSFLQYGWSWTEIVWKRRNGPSRDATLDSKFDDQKIGIRKLAIRSQDSLWKWEFDPKTDELQALTQNPPPDYAMRTIPLEKSLLFRTKIARGNPEGRSILRGAYRSWYMLKNLQALEGIGAERDLAGLPVLKPPPGVNIWNANDAEMTAMRAQAEMLVSSIRRDEQEGVLLPEGWELTLLSTGGRRQFNTHEIIDRYEKRIASSVLADVIILGQSQVGSYALADSKEGIFFASLDTYLDHICAEINNDLLRPLFTLNAFPGITDYPKLCHGPVARLDLKTLGEFLASLTQSGAAIWPNEELLIDVFTRAGLPAPDPDDGLPMNPADQADDVEAKPADAGQEMELPVQAVEGNGSVGVS